MKLFKIELAGVNETFLYAFFHQNETLSSEVLKKIWEKRKESAFLVMWKVPDKSEKSNRLLLDCLISQELLELKSTDDIKAWVQKTKAKI